MIPEDQCNERKMLGGAGWLLSIPTDRRRLVLAALPNHGLMAQEGKRSPNTKFLGGISRGRPGGYPYGRPGPKTLTPSLGAQEKTMQKMDYIHRTTPGRILICKSRPEIT